MCMRNANVTMMMCSSLKIDNNIVTSFENVFDSVIPIRKNDEYYIENLNIMLNACVIFGEEFESESNCIQLDTKYDFLIRLTHVESGLGTPLFPFTVEIHKDDVCTWCKDFYEFKKAIAIRELAIPKGLGNYALKLLVKKSGGDEKWRTQTIHRLVIGGSR